MLRLGGGGSQGLGTCGWVAWGRLGVLAVGTRKDCRQMGIFRLAAYLQYSIPRYKHRGGTKSHMLIECSSHRETWDCRCRGRRVCSCTVVHPCVSISIRWLQHFQCPTCAWACAWACACACKCACALHCWCIFKMFLVFLVLHCRTIGWTHFLTAHSPVY